MRLLSSRVIAVAAIVVLAVAARPASAHHAVQAEFDQNKKATITGVLTRVMWVNPHVRWQMEVKNPKTGKVETWDISGGAPGGFRAIGITSKDVFKVGETYTAIVALARDGSTTGHVFAFILPDGRKIDMWQQYSQ
jgi:Family of unknown function (DUF6152)